MSPTRRKRATATAKAKVKMSRAEKVLVRAGLIKEARLTAADRKKLRKLSLADARALVRVKRALAYKGTLMLPLGIF
jgi:hypothetical protein